jgi:hypothetical protein
LTILALIKDSCVADPTHFSSVSYYYRQTVESILDKEFMQGSNADDLRNFKETYGHSAFVCRYPKCERSSDGFNSQRKREEHESKHTRKFRCPHSTCESFGKGFATQAALNRHNNKYHTTVIKSSSLLDAISSRRQSDKLQYQHQERDELLNIWLLYQITEQQPITSGWQSTISTTLRLAEVLRL